MILVVEMKMKRKYGTKFYGQIPFLTPLSRLLRQAETRWMNSDTQPLGRQLKGATKRLKQNQTLKEASNGSVC